VSKRYAVISVGTNSARLLLADVGGDDPRADVARSIGTRIGEGLGPEGSLGEEPMRRTLDAIAQLYRTVRGHYVRLFAIGTSALRRAGNAQEFGDRVQELLGVPLRILSGEEEAAASYRGALTALGVLRGERVGVADIGGGSTEYAVGTGAEPERHASCEIGAVRLTEAVPPLAGRDGVVDRRAIERAKGIAEKALAPLREFEPIERIALAGGSATTAAAIVRRSKTITSHAVSRTDLQNVLERLSAMPLDERKRVVGMKPQRADILPAGIIVLDTVLEIVGQNAATATTADLLLGFLLQQRDALGATAGQRPPVPAGSESRRGYRS
jgi:exopolyphosphatase / guanosine-5'-triphosphate,3'-diphosphate pyrophosphatase